MVYLPKKKIGRFYTRLPSVAEDSDANHPPIPTIRPKVDDLPSESLVEFVRNQWTITIGLGGRFGSESLVGMARNTQGSNKYHLYGHFKELCPETKINFDFLKRALVRREQVENEGGEKSLKKIDLQHEIGASDEELKHFLCSFELHVCEEYEGHRDTVINEISRAFQVSIEEVRLYHYPTAFTLISALACNPTEEGRTILREDFFQKVRPKQALYNCWTLREKSQAFYCRDMRKNYFSDRNIDPDARFFILETPEGTADSALKDMVLQIRKKWSSHAVRRKPDRERYAPYIYLKSVSPDQVLKLKISLHHEGCIFVDGYPFQGADFCHETINKAQTKGNKLSLRLLNTEENLLDCLSQLAQRKQVFQFFIDKPIELEGNFTQVCIPITSTQMVVNIV